MSMPVNVVVRPGENPVLYLHDAVGPAFWSDEEDNSSRAWAQALDRITADRVTVRINSLGGSAFDGIAIYNLLKAHPAWVDVVVDGVAASAASVVAMAGDTVTMAVGSQMMIHEAASGCWGNAGAMEQCAKSLHACSDSIASIYAARAGGGVANWRELMRAETWLTAEQAVECGLADIVDEGELVTTAQTKNETPAAPLAQHNEKEGTVNDQDALRVLAQRLDLPADATPEQVVNLATQRLDATPPAPIAAPQGTVIVDKATLEALQTQAAEGAAAIEAAALARREARLDKAIEEGRLVPSARAVYAELLERDETLAGQVLDSLTPNTVPVNPVGYTTGDTPQDYRAELVARMDGEDI
jgi:ATP-dependent protease ClpP protease subunit